MPTPTLEETLIFATQCHTGQVDKSGGPYILHPLRVMAGLGHSASLEERQVALLHDVVEDCGVTSDDLRASGFSEKVVTAVGCLTKTLDEMDDDNGGYVRFIERCKANPLAARVKLADLADNLDTSRLPEITTRDRDRLTKYEAARAVLQS